MSGSTGPLALGVDLGGTKIHAELLHPDGHAVWRQRLPTPAGSYPATLACLADVVGMAREQAPRQLGGHPGAHPAMTVGIGGPGSEGPDGTLKNANSTCLNGQRLVHDLEQRIGQPVRYANDANCLALSEARDGAGAGLDVVFAVILGTGVGGGVALRGQVFNGPNGLSGEWGHNPLPWMTDDERAIAHAERCWCGRAGCIESFLSGPAMARDHHRHTGQHLSAHQVAQAAAAGDDGAARTLQRHAERLARALATVINLIDPDVIVLAGGLSLMPHLYRELPRHWAPHVFDTGGGGARRTRLSPAAHGDASGVRGAAWLWHGRGHP